MGREPEWYHDTSGYEKTWRAAGKSPIWIHIIEAVCWGGGQQAMFDSRGWVKRIDFETVQEPQFTKRSFEAKTSSLPSSKWKMTQIGAPWLNWSAIQLG